MGAVAAVREAVVDTDAGCAALWHDSFRELGEHIRGLHERCHSAYHAFDDLPRLVDELRILSVNAELASARAGDYGRAVRVLTHFATESVTRLLSVVPAMVELKKTTYSLAGTVMRAAADIAKIEAAGHLVLREGHRFPAGEGDPLDALEGARQKRLAALIGAVGEMGRAHQHLVEAVRSVREVTMQAEIIAANVAIEATSAGPHEVELQSIADTMRSRVDQLRAMIDMAGRDLRAAADTNVKLSSLATLLRR